MSRDYPFIFMFEVSDEFLRHDPQVAERYLDIAKAEIATRKYATGPRGGTYRLVGPPLGWEMDRNPYSYHGFRGMTLYMTRRVGRYTRPDRVRIVDEDGPSFTTLTVEVKDGETIGPKGQVVQTDAAYVAFPVLSHG